MPAKTCDEIAELWDTTEKVAAALVELSNERNAAGDTRAAMTLAYANGMLHLLAAVACGALQETTADRLRQIRLTLRDAIGGRGFVPAEWES